MASTAEMQEKLNNYWRERQKQAEKSKLGDHKEIQAEMMQLYQGVQKDIEKEIDAFYARYATREGVSKKEAKRRASETDVKAFSDKAKRYVEEKNFSDQANEELKLYNLEMRVSRLELLKYNIDLELVALGNEEMNITRRIKSEAFMREMRDQAGILALSTPNNKTLRQMVQAVINKPYHGASFSERIWGRNEDIRNWLGNNIGRNIIRGKNPRDLIPELRTMFDATEYEAERLAITEQGYIQTEAQRISYEEAETEEYDLMVESDACDVCQDIADDGPYKVKDMQVGVNAPMIHPFCQCGTAPRPDREGLEQMFRDLGL